MLSDQFKFSILNMFSKYILILLMYQNFSLIVILFSLVVDC